MSSDSKNNLILVGFMGTGKTTIGRSLSRVLGRRFVDTDVEIEAATGLSIPDIFKLYGERYFRAIEKQVIVRLAASSGLVVATGGGAVLDSEVRAMLKQAGIVFCLTARAEVILARTQANQDRPLLRDRAFSTIVDLMNERESYYKFADFTIDTSDLNISEVVQEVLKRWQEGRTNKP